MIVHSGASMADKYSRYVELYNKNLAKWGRMAEPIKSYEDFAKSYNKLWKITRSTAWSAETVIKKIVSRDTTKISHEQAIAATKGKKTTYWEARYGNAFWDLVKESYDIEKNRRIAAEEDSSGKALKHFIATTYFGSPE